MKARFLLLLLTRLESIASFSQRQNERSPTPKYKFHSFEFDHLGFCRKPSFFQHTEHGKDTQVFVMKNVSGDGDCVFQAVISASLVSMGMIDPDAFSTVPSMALHMRKVVAKLLSSPEGTLYVDRKQARGRVLRCQDVLQSAAKKEGLTEKEYLSKLCKPGREGGLHGGGPELTVLSNVLRRPISIYHLKQTSLPTGDVPCEIERMGVFGEGLFEDVCATVPDSVISNAGVCGLEKATHDMELQLKSSWHLHILIVDASDKEKHATALLPSVQYP